MYMIYIIIYGCAGARCQGGSGSAAAAAAAAGAAPAAAGAAGGLRPWAWDQERWSLRSWVRGDGLTPM